jgi:CheY-like chemotaxis protein
VVVVGSLAFRAFLQDGELMLTVLLVEDHPMNRKLFRDILLMQFDVVEVASAEEALQRLQTLSPDLILLDMQLPGMDGLSLARLLRADPDRGRIPIVGLSAHAMTQDIELAHEAGCVDYITKPITDDPFTFLERVSRSLSGVRSQESGVREEPAAPCLLPPDS